MEYIHNLAAELPVPDGLGVRISGFHPDGPGSIPGLGDFCSLKGVLIDF